MKEINRIPVARDNFESRWGVVVNDYQYEGSAAWVDFMTLVVDMSKNRAVTVEAEIAPMSTRTRLRNQKLEELGNALADLQGIQKYFKDDSAGTTKLSEMVGGTAVAQSTVDLLKSLGMSEMSTDPTRRDLEVAVQTVKTKIDRLNNDAQTDMTRLQSLVDRRDESYNTASDLLSEVSAARSNAIRNM